MGPFKRPYLCIYENLVKEVSDLTKMHMNFIRALAKKKDFKKFRNGEKSWALNAL